MANRSEELRRTTTKLLKLCCSRTHYEEADDDTKYPYITFITDSQNKNYYPRSDDIIIIDIWDKGKSRTEAERLADLIEKNMDMKNEPNDVILPTFYLIDRRNLKDPDKTIKHVQLKYLVQNYYIGE